MAKNKIQLDVNIDEIHWKEHRAIADKITHVENAIGILNERLDEIAQGEECRPKSDIKFDVIIKRKKTDEKTGDEFWLVDKRLLNICGQDLAAIVMAATRLANTEVEIRRSN